MQVRGSKTNPFGDREDHRLLLGPFAEAIKRLRCDAAADDHAGDHVIPVGPH